jgi:MoaA/NifB/PqqE/SkfB family radical SAM enzyme
MKLSQSISYPKWVVLQLIENCNLRCNMCYEWGETGSYHEKEKLSCLDYDLVLQIIKDCLPGKPYFEFFGGEPMLYPQIAEVIRSIREAGCELGIPTNGTLIEKHAEMLVETQPTRLWISLDGPERINDRQRGKGVFQKVIKGIDKLYELRSAKNSEFPQIGITFVITPLNYAYIDEFFFSSIDISKIDCISLEFQNYATEEQYQQYAEMLATEFGIFSSPCAKGYVLDPAQFSQMDFEIVVDRMLKVKNFCRENGIQFAAQAKTIELDNIRNYYTANWEKMDDRRSRCALPWTYLEISAAGEVTVCHTFYDLPLGNVYQESILDIWNGEKINKVRDRLRKQLYPICTACCRYYSNSLS